MSLSFNSDSVVGGPISPGPLTQIEQRKKILEKRSGRSKDDVLFLTSNTGWVKMTSSVDIFSESREDFENRRKTDQSAVPKTDDSAARSNVLTGGTLKNRKLTAGIFNGADTAYSKSTLQGYRPDAGITSFQVDTKSMFGALRVATVEFKVNSVEQLDTLESLFLRPGFSILLEWGHSIYVDNQGMVNKTPNTYSDFFTPARDPQEILDRIQEIKARSSYNYDGMFGIVKNFIWSYNLDGGYDCKVDLVSQGELIESLSVIISPKKQNNGSIEDEDQNLETRRLIQSDNTRVDYDQVRIRETLLQEVFNYGIGRTPLHTFLNVLNLPDRERTDKVETLSTRDDVRQLFEILVGKVGIEREDLKILKWEYINADKDNQPTYSEYTLIPLQYLLILIQEIFLLKTKEEKPNTVTNSEPAVFVGNLEEALSQNTLEARTQNTVNQLQDKDRTYIAKFYTGNNEKINKTPFVTFSYHTALDPTKVILPKSDSLSRVNTTNNKLKGYNPQYNNIVNELNPEDILNIFISTDLILNILDATIDSAEPTRQTVLTFINALLAEINKQLGNINDLDITYDETQNLHYIVDRKITPIDNESLKTIDLVGIKSQVENLSFASKLSNKVTSMMAIAAQSQNTDVGVDTLAVQKWNEGLVDRHLLFKFVGQESKSDKETREKRIIPFIKNEDLLTFRDFILASNTGGNSSELNYVNDEKYSDIIVVHRNVMKGSLEYFTKKAKTNPAGLIPFELSLTLKGISGLKVGQAFKIPNQLIPARYRNNVAFIITGVSHKLQSNRWVTDLQTQMCIVSKVESTEIEEQEVVLPNPEDLPPVQVSDALDIRFESIFGPATTGVRMKTRLNDPTGAGLYDSSRPNNPSGKHLAWDVVAANANTGREFPLEGKPVYTPISGIVTFEVPGSKFQKLRKDIEGKLIIIGEGKYQGITTVLRYVKKGFRIKEDNVGYRIVAGTPIGYAGSVSTTYQDKEGMKDHIHIEMYYEKNGTVRKIDPRKEKWFPKPAPERVTD